jgi:hypothetical protein
MQGVTGFFLAALMWFAIPSSIAITTGMTFLSLKDENGCLPLTMEQIDEGKCTFHSYRGDHRNKGEITPSKVVFNAGLVNKSIINTSERIRVIVI